MKKIIITIDGYSSCGKSTLAKAIAKELNYIFIDSGAMYRAITLYFLENKVDISDELAVDKALQHIQLRFQYHSATQSSHILLNGADVEDRIREMSVSNAVSKVAAIANVRAFAVAQQREMGESKGIVMDGRDIGTTVFPHAELKIFMTADKMVRAQRRFEELKEKKQSVSIEEVIHNIEMRDEIDTNREVSPLRKAQDAVVIDNSYLTPSQQLSMAMDWVKEKVS